MNTCSAVTLLSVLVGFLAGVAVMCLVSVNHDEIDD